MFQHSRKALAIVGLIALVFVLGMVGWWLDGDENCSDAVCWVQGTLGFFIHDTSHQPATWNWELAAAHYLAPFSVPLVALMMGIWASLGDFRHDWRGMRAARMKGHVIVCGLGDIGLQILENLDREKQKVVAVDLVDDSSRALAAERIGAAVIKGNGRHLSVLRAAGLRGANIVVICVGEDSENIDIALRIKESVESDKQARADPLRLFVELRDEWLFSRLIDHDRESLGSAKCEIKLFNTYQNTAHMLLQAMPPPLASADHVGPVVIVGFGSMGREVALQLVGAGLAPIGQKLRLIIIDRVADDLKESFKEVARRVADYAEVTFIAADLNEERASNWRPVEDLLRDEAPFAVVVCLPEDQPSLHVGMMMRTQLDQLGRRDVPIHVRLGNYVRLGEFAGRMEQRAGISQRLAPFGSLQEILETDNLLGVHLDELAQAYHNERRRRQPPAVQRQSNWAPWPELAEQYKMSSRREADHLAVKLAQLGYSLMKAAAPAVHKFTRAECALLGQLEHRRWMIERLLQRWHYGPLRDNDALTNPLLVDWADLPERNRRDDAVQFVVLPDILAKAGYEICRVRRVVLPKPVPKSPKPKPPPRRAIGRRKQTAAPVAAS